MNNFKFKDIVIDKKGFLRGPFGGDLKKEIFVEKADDTYKVYEQGVVLNSDKTIGRYYISEKDYLAKLHKFSVQDKDFLISCSGVNMGAIYQLHEPFERGVINQALLRVRLNNEIIDDNYFYYLFKELISKRITTGSGDSTIPNFPPLEVIKNVDLQLPRKETQEIIGKILSDLDTKIELNNKINAELEAMAKTLYDYWFVQFDFPDINGKPYKTSGGKMVWNEELKREIPEGWEVKRVEDVLTKETSFKKIPSSEYQDKGSVPIIDQSTDFIAGFTNDNNFKIDCKTPRIVFGDHTRILKLINFDFARGADGTQVLLSNNKRNPQHLFYYSLLKIDLSNYGYARHFKFLKDSKIILPEEIIAHKFERIVSDFYKKIKSNIFQNQELASLRDWLLPMLMNGQVIVGEVAALRQAQDDKLGMVAEEGERYGK
jgi:type I restriction enzyme S subunit